MNNETWAIPPRKIKTKSLIITIAELLFIVGLIAAAQFKLIRIPTLTIPFLIIGGISLRARGLRWQDIGFQPPKNWRKTILLALLIAIGYQLFSVLLWIPFLEQTLGQSIDLSSFDQLRDNIGLLFISLIASWTLAAFGEEVVYRGYILNRFADVSTATPFRWLFGLLISSLLFGWVHQYQGMIGILDTFVAGAVFGGVYFYSKRNLWMSIFAHGFVDTIGFALLYFHII